LHEGKQRGHRREFTRLIAYNRRDFPSHLTISFISCYYL
jgi:hypothetical protein